MNKPYVGAMRIYHKDEHQPMADLAIFHDGKFVRIDTINYDDINTRESYYINAYTLVWDERLVVDTFSDYISSYKLS